MQAVFTNIYEASLLCRPRNIIKFSIRFLQDCKAANPDEAHAYHFLPFLLHNPDDFQSQACTIYCAMVSGKSLLLGNAAAGDASSKPPEQSFREYLDGNAVLEVIQGLDLPSLGLQSPSIDELVTEKVEVLKQVDFQLFLSILRLVLSLYAIQVWLRDEVAELLLLYNPISVFSLPLPLDMLVDSAKLRSFMQRKSRGSSRKYSRHCYHLHRSLHSQEDQALLNKLLLAVIEDERAQILSLEAMGDKLVRKYLQMHGSGGIN